MPLHWRIGSLPELAHLSPRRRRQLLRRNLSVWAYVAVASRCVVLGIVAAPLAGLTVAGTSTTLARMMMLPAFLLVVLLTYQRWVRRTRSDLQAYLREAHAGASLPVCLECGYDLEGIEADRCPECGEWVKVPGSIFEDG